MKRVIEGVLAFKREIYPKNSDLFQQLAHSQNPEYLFITCADSRIVPSLITQTKPGDLFICRNAGNMVPSYGELNGGVSATIEYAVSVLNVKEIIVCGHSDCGAMKGVLYPEKVAEMPAVRSWLGQGERARRIVLENFRDLPEKEKLDRLVQENVIAQLDHLRTHPSVAARLARGAVGIHGWVYDIATGSVEGWDPQGRRFVPLGSAGAAEYAELEVSHR